MEIQSPWLTAIIDRHILHYLGIAVLVYCPIVLNVRR